MACLEILGLHRHLSGISYKKHNREEEKREIRSKPTLTDFLWQYAKRIWAVFYIATSGLVLYCSGVARDSQVLHFAGAWTCSGNGHSPLESYLATIAKWRRHSCFRTAPKGRKWSCLQQCIHMPAKPSTVISSLAVPQLQWQTYHVWWWEWGFMKRAVAMEPSATYSTSSGRK